ncbi:ABC transporter permease subunit [Rhizobium bangladeshense]|uniref:ABC transporter permease subunit n=1 Tax=Rhizobium bangladeshense TaxID=1138189 RepID=UPI001A98DC73|nr:ABC transporter permease subunit [Rhizobium bangladeshense]MBX4891390.1 ABC transporter permease subunit [Rhizobium bangladeshense]MBX4934382.1 ABC transporter permease subunit [Rhizobium bangladeshense]MBY3582999.1 ABC transporter permease subunit [Rhizobium bangladeshense]QSY90786.1 ABC transporter permease subunit [Rhizobium bangladeshense]
MNEGASNTAAELPVARPSRAKPARSRTALTAIQMGLISMLTVLLVLAVWIAVTHLGLVKPLFLPKVETVLNAFISAIEGNIDGAPLTEHVLMSLFRVISAFLLAALIGIPVGLSMGLSPAIRAMLDPFIEFYRPLPPLAYLPLVIIWFGIGETSKVLLIFLACFAPVALAARAGVLSASSDQINAARALGASRWQLLCFVVFPAALPDILVGLRIGMGVGWTTLVAAEMVAASTGVGQMVLNASNFLRTDIVMMGIFVIGFFAIMFEFAMRWLERKLVPWRGRA